MIAPNSPTTKPATRAVERADFCMTVSGSMCVAARAHGAQPLDGLAIPKQMPLSRVRPRGRRRTPEVSPCGVSFQVKRRADRPIGGLMAAFQPACGLGVGARRTAGPRRRLRHRRAHERAGRAAWTHGGGGCRSVRAIRRGDPGAPSGGRPPPIAGRASAVPERRFRRRAGTARGSLHEGSGGGAGGDGPRGPPGRHRGRMRLGSRRR